MEKIMTLTKEQFSKFEKARSQAKTAKELIGINQRAKIGIGDTSVAIDNAQPREVYKLNWKGNDYYYIVIESMDISRAFCYSIYPKIYD